MEEILSAEHQQEIKKYLDFFYTKRREGVGELETVSKQFKSRVAEEMFSKSEVEDLLNALMEELSNTFEGEFQNIVQMSGVYVKTLMVQAQNSGVTLSSEISSLENHRAIEEIKKIERGEKQFELNKKTTQGARLPTLQAGFNNDPNLVRNLNELKEENQKFKERINQLQSQVSELIDERNHLKQQNAQLSEQAQKVGERVREYNEETQVYNEKSKEISQALEETRLELRSKEELVQQLREEQEKRLSESKQFQNLKKLMNTKNEQLKELREQLNKLQSK